LKKITEKTKIPIGISKVAIVRAENIFTYSRIFGAFIVSLMLLYDIKREVVFFFYVFFALTDLVDGFISRRKDKNLKKESVEGKTKSEGDILDPVADKVLFISVLVVIIYLQKVPIIASLIVIIREIFVLGLRAIAEMYGIHIKSSSTAKIKTFFGNISVSAYILKDEYFGISASFVGDVFLILCFIFSVISGVEYISKFQKEKLNLSKSSKIQKDS
jgi:CDP-diacylglycerol--glycerol-3-phosphate 3-phosphatidyltransferase